ncbi:MAG TPA: restriction endonuclease subunit S [Cyclobacteriaceae bacterium]|nr:restriction endonuclease subunit S [Cyclobacteriaceae bacterium]
MKELAPELRFNEFRGNWQVYRLGEIATFSKGKGLSKKDLDKNGKVECIRYGELYTIYGETIDKTLSRTRLPIEDLILSEANDVVLPASGETQIDIATASCVLRKGIALGGDLNIIKTKNNGVFLSYYLNSKKRKDIAMLAQGISVVHLYASQLSSLLLNLPSLPEQQKIASFLSAVDEKIQLLTRKKELLEQYKKGVMQQLFSGKVRFRDEKGKEYPKWQKKKLGETLEIGSGRDYKHLGSGKIPVYGTGGLMTMVNDFLYDGETVCIGRKGTIDKPFYYDGKIWTVDTLFYTHNFKTVIPKFIYFLFQQINWKLFNEASGVPSLSKTTIEKIEVSIPVETEQRRISNFLTAIDNKIAGVTTQIEQVKIFKRGLLQQMFV